MFRFRQKFVSQFTNGIRHRGGEQQRLPILRRSADDVVNVIDEAHVEHFIRFVKHNEPDIVE